MYYRTYIVKAVSSVMGSGFHTKTFLDSLDRHVLYLCVKSFQKKVWPTVCPVSIWVWITCTKVV